MRGRRRVLVAALIVVHALTIALLILGPTRQVPRYFALSIYEDFGPSDADADYPLSWTQGLPFDAVTDYETVIHDPRHEPLARILGIEFEPSPR